MPERQRPNTADGLDEDMSLSFLEMTDKVQRPTKEEERVLRAANAQLGYGTDKVPAEPVKKPVKAKGQGGRKTARPNKTAPVVVLNDTAKAAPSALRKKSARKSRKPSTQLCTHRARYGVKELISSLADEMDLYERGAYELAIYTVIEKYGSAELKARCDQLLPDIKDFDGSDSAKTVTD